MHRFSIVLFSFCLQILLVAQDEFSLNYEVSDENPYGLFNPEAPPELLQFSPMIGTCQCKSIQRNQDGSWQDTLDMLWRFKYIQNGTAVQDEVWRENGLYAGSVRQYHSDSSLWVVTYFSYPSVSLTPGTWTGKMIGDSIVLRMPQKAPNGKDGFSRLTFHNLRELGYDWKGEWIDKTESFIYPFWQIYCTRKE